MPTVQYSPLCYDFAFVLTVFSKFGETVNPIAPVIKFANSQNSHVSRAPPKELRPSDSQADWDIETHICMWQREIGIGEGGGQRTVALCVCPRETNKVINCQIKHKTLEISFFAAFAFIALCR